MEGPKFYMLFVAAIIPMIIGSIWYSEKVFGKTWMTSAGLKADDLKTGNMAIIFGLAYFFSLLLAFTLMQMTIHQSGMQSLFATHPDFETPGSEIKNYYDNFMATYGDRHRDFGHGALHGGIASIFMALPIIGISALFERRGWKYIMVHFGYWFVTMLLMGGVICAFF